MFMYFYCYACSVQCILFHFAVICIVFVYMCTVQLPPGVNKYFIHHIISFHIIRGFCTWIIVLWLMYVEDNIVNYGSVSRGMM